MGANESNQPKPAPMLRRVVGLFAPYRRRVLLLGLSVTITSALGTAAPLLTKWVFDHALFRGGGQKPDIPLLVILVSAMVASRCWAACSRSSHTYLSSGIGQRVMQDLRDRLYAHLQTMSLRFFTATRTGEIQSRLANDVGGVQTVVTQAFRRSSRTSSS